jgi:hypothetical protein
LLGIFQSRKPHKALLFVLTALTKPMLLLAASISACVGER